MDIPWGSEESGKFVTNVGLITSKGPGGPNIMAAEWTHHVSYSPGIIMVNINAQNGATAVNIEKTGVFGVNIAAEDQNTAASVAGGSSGTTVDKIGVLKEMGVEFYEGRKTGIPMVKGAALNAECRLIRMEKLGSHTMFIGEVVDVSSGGGKPLVYNGGKYRVLGGKIEKPPQTKLDEIAELVKKHSK